MDSSQDKRNQIIAIIIIAAVIICGIVYFISKSSPEGTPSSTASSTATISTSTGTSISVSNASSSTGSGYTIHLISSGAGGTAPVAPNYKAPLVFSGSVSADEQASLQSQFTATEAALATDKTDFNAWIALGDERKEAGDYAGAALDWQYMSEIYPTNLVSNANLADLYTNYLPNYPKAAAAYKAAIAHEPAQTYLYQDLFQLYTTQYPQSSAVAAAVLKQGIAANPKATDLMVTLARYYKSTGDITDAKAEYSAAITVAQAQGDQQLVDSLQQEYASL